MTDYKNTLNLLQTDFPMKADLPKREPERLAQWQSMGLYHLIQEKTAKNPTFILHDGPPYANANIHMGTALNKTLKDVVVKSKLLSGFRAPFVPGWDCHGLPIELNVEKKLGKVGDKLDAKAFRSACRDYAQSQVALQKSDFERLGVLGDWQNPYLTMDFSYEANVVRALSKMVANGHLLRGQKPVHWCTACGSALAEAEVEYKDKTSHAIDVAFNVIDAAECGKVFGANIGNAVFPIWTTTPWTLPANEAVAVNPELSYALVETRFMASQLTPHYFILAQELIEKVMARYGITDYQVIGATLGKNLENILLQHPFLNKKVPVILGDHVTVEAGTGAVHTAPAHGQEDYVVGVKYQLPMNNPVNAQGCFIDSTPIVSGMHVFKANEPIIEALKNTNHLLHHETINHSYAHCWRHKTPLIFRATPQWFISMTQKKLRDDVLKAIPSVKWIPSWGENRITAMIAARPDWCISRQRAWGIPITLLVHKETGELHPDILSIMEKAAGFIEKKGIDGWYECDIHELTDNADNYEKTKDVLDVWFDSGSSHFCVLEKRPELSAPADLYLEGSDQHRGWFHTSLLTSVAMNNASPFRSVLTHGYVVDAQGRKMSKSVGNTISPADIVKKYGADILRLWVMSSDYTDDVSVSDEILNRCSDAYRRIRNTLRFMLSNLFDFNPKTDCVPAKELLRLDQWMLHQTCLLQEKIQKNYEAYQFSAIYHDIHNFCSVDLSSFYFDILKDRLYTAAKSGKPRRSAQTVLYYLGEMLTRWLAPIVSFTAEEAYQMMPGAREKSVFFTKWWGLPEQDKNILIPPPELLQYLQKLRNDVNKALEENRALGKIGSALEASVTLQLPKDAYHFCKEIASELKFFFIVSEVVLEEGDTQCIIVNKLPDSYVKCSRCWHRNDTVGKNTDHPELCERCVINIMDETGENRLFA